MKVIVVNRGTEGVSLCFKVMDISGKEYIISDCQIKETFGEFKEGYFGSYEGHPVHLNFFSKDNAELLFNNEILS